MTSGPEEIQPLTTSAVDQLVVSIRELISDRGLGVGDSLPTERELCLEFGASRNTVREAMRILKAYGVVDVRPKIGATIIDKRVDSALKMFSFNMLDVSRETFLDIQGFRSLIEVSAVEELFDHLQDNDIAEIRRINGALQNDLSLDSASETDFRFHVRLVSILANKAVLDVYKIMKPIIIRIMKSGKTRQSYRDATFWEHEAIIDALEMRDRVVYQYLMKTHLRMGLALFASPPDKDPAKKNNEVQQPTT